MKCSACGSEETFFRNRIVLCLKCGATWDRPKVGPSVTDLQLQVDELKRLLTAAVERNLVCLEALNRIAEYRVENPNMMGMYAISYLMDVARKALESTKEKS